MTASTYQKAAKENLDANQEADASFPIEEAARLIGMTHWGLRYLLRNKRIGAVRSGRRLMFSARELLRMMAERKHK